MQTILGIFLVLGIAVDVNGHGRLMDPPSRASMWRAGFSNPADYNDNEGFCGGFNVQWEQNGGKCGICGDNWADEVREHEAPNRFANGIIAAVYKPGQEIDITVDITANHLGFFTFRLCPAESEDRDPQQDCFDANVLKVLPDMEDKYYLPNSNVGDFVVRVQLPEIECERCILQWTYTAGNNWGWCSPNYGDLGCGPQETFRACSDISIKREVKSPQQQRQSRPIKPYSQILQQKEGTVNQMHRKKVNQLNKVNKVNRVNVEASMSKCRGVGSYSRLPGIDNWCTDNCRRPNSYCPSTHCTCF